MTIDENGVSNFEAKIQAKDVKTDNVFSLFGESFKKGLSGDVKIFDAKIKGKGKNWEQISRSLSGKISLFSL